LVGANLSYANLTESILDWSDSSQADLSSAKLIKASVVGTDFSEANLTGANLLNIVYDTRTRFPTGFTLPVVDDSFRVVIKRYKVDQTRAVFPLPQRLTIDTFLSAIGEPLTALDFTYSVLALIDARTQVEYKELLHLLKAENNPSISSLHLSLNEANVKPLRLLSVHYGSDASFDLLGVGKILEFLRQTVKDLVWQAKHEREMANLEKDAKEQEIVQMRLAAEEKRVDILYRQLEVFEKASELNLQEEEKRAIVSLLLPQTELLASGTSLRLERIEEAPPSLPEREE
jgi:hypothetical protein